MKKKYLSTSCLCEGQIGKILRYMRLAFAVILLLGFQIRTKVYSQKASLNIQVTGKVLDQDNKYG